MKNITNYPLTLRFFLLSLAVFLCAALIFTGDTGLFGRAAPAPLLAQSDDAFWPDITITEVQSGLTEPIHVTHAGDGSGRLFIVERAGVIRVMENDTLLETPLLDIRDKVESGGRECGLLSIAFPPDYDSKGYFFVYYNSNTNRTGEDAGCDSVIARFRISSSDANVADLGSEEVIMEVDQPYDNHNGGQLAFRDGYLFVGLGDGGSGGDPGNRAQTTSTLLGKMLRIEVGETGTYTVPEDNPFVGDSAYRPEIWALGLRNPWRYSFDRKTGDLYIGDVGQQEREEIDFQPASSPGGENFGWRITEGDLCFNPSDGCDRSGLTGPIQDYERSQGFSVTGGVVSRHPEYPRMNGVYIYGDFVSGRIWGLRRVGVEWVNQELRATDHRISSFGEDEAGHVYLADFGGAIYRITDNLRADPNNAVYLPIINANASGSQQAVGQGDRYWDPRLDQRGAIFTPAEVTVGQGYWRLIRAVWFNTEESEGRHHIFVDTLDELGTRQTGVPIHIGWPEGTDSITTEAKLGEPWAANYAMFSIAPAYKAHPDTGAPADTIDGMGMGEIDAPQNAHHTSYGLTWQWTIAGSATTTPSPTGTIPPAATQTASPTASPTATGTPGIAPTITPTPSATAVGGRLFIASAPDCETPSNNSIRLEGKLTLNGQPANGYSVAYGFNFANPGDDSPQPLAVTQSGPPDPAGFYAHVMSKGETWYTWVMDEDGKRISDLAQFRTDDPGQTCSLVKINFMGTAR